MRTTRPATGVPRPTPTPDDIAFHSVGEPVRPDHDSSPFEIAVVHVEQRDGGDVLDTEEIQPIAIMPVDAQPSRSQCRDEVPFVGSGVHSYTRLVE
jgi:hypothetical protein